jgi:type III secretory pathway component EscV
MLQKRGFVIGVIAYVVISAVLVYLINIYGNAAIIVSAMASVALVFVTAALVFATYTYAEASDRQAEAMNRQAQAQEEHVKATDRQAEAMNRQAQAQEEHVKATDRQVAALTDPLVFFGTEEVSTIDQFFVQNVGPGIAYDVNFKVMKDFDSAILLNDQKLSDLAFIKNTIKTLAPGQKIPFAIVNPHRIQNLIKEIIEVEVSYKNKLEAKGSFKKRFPMEFAYFEGMAQVRPTSIADHVKKIADGIEALKKQ